MPGREPIVRAARSLVFTSLLALALWLATTSLSPSRAAAASCTGSAPDISDPVVSNITSYGFTVSSTISANGSDTTAYAHIGIPPDLTGPMASFGTVHGNSTETRGATFTTLKPGTNYDAYIYAVNGCGKTVKSLSDRVHTDVRVTVSIEGAPGRVTSNPAGISCSGSGDPEYPDPTQNCVGSFEDVPPGVFPPPDPVIVDLLAEDTSEGVFSEWGGACSFAGEDRHCFLLMGSDYLTLGYPDFKVTALYAPVSVAPTLTVLRTGTGSGRVTSSVGGIDCSQTKSACSATFSAGQTVTLTAMPDVGSAFVGWGGEDNDCKGTGPCTLTMSSSKTATAIFDLGYRLTVGIDPESTGRGSVVSSPTGIVCPGTCTAAFPLGAEVTLTALPAPGSTFVGWDGVCFDRSPLAPCTVLMITDLELNAEFSNPLAEASGNSAGMGEECTILGTNGNDVLRGTAGDDVICGLGGNDRLIGGGGNDILKGGLGNDVLIGGAGHNKLYGGAGKDRLYARNGSADFLDGGPGRDIGRRDKRGDKGRSIEAWIS
jgi:hypothetical protein